MLDLTNIICCAIRKPIFSRYCNGTLLLSLFIYNYIYFFISFFGVKPRLYFFLSIQG